MKDQQKIRTFIENKRDRESLVLCTLVRKSGSSYRGPGAKKVVSLAGGSLGFLSGGCLEASIEKTARERWDTLPCLESFSTLAEEDRLLGYQTGCQGVIEILFEKITDQDLDLLVPLGADALFKGVRVDLRREYLGERSITDELPLNENDFLLDPWVEPIELVIVGCGADADVYAPLADAMGWPTRFVDYRASLLDDHRFLPFRGECLPLAQIGEAIPEGPRVAVILMTHNYEADLEILRSLNDHNLGYLGCLGPAARFERLRQDLLGLHGIPLSPGLERVSFAPAGLFTKGKTPEEIALSIVAQIQDQLIEQPKIKSWTMILAAGPGTRFGAQPKPLAPWRGGTLLDQALATAQEFSPARVLIVTGAHSAVEEHLRKLEFGTHVRNVNWSAGMGASIATGFRRIRELEPQVDQVIILPVDQPLVQADHLRRLRAAARRTGRCALTSAGPLLSPPAAIPAPWFGKAEALTGDVGLRSVLEADEFVGVAHAEAVVDVDTDGDLARATELQTNLEMKT